MRTIAYVFAVIAIILGFAFMVSGILSLPSTPNLKIEGSIAMLEAMAVMLSEVQISATRDSAFAICGAIIFIGVPILMGLDRIFSELQKIRSNVAQEEYASVCVLCREPVNPDATICPHCRSQIVPMKATPAPIVSSPLPERARTYAKLR